MKKHLSKYKTKTDHPIYLEVVENSEGDNNRGWIVHQINAYVDGIHAGYIKISYIPKDRFLRYYPTILNFMSQISGHCLLPFDNKSLHYELLDDEELKRAVRSLAYHSRKYYSLWNTGEGIPESREELLDIIKEIIKNELKDHKKKFRDFEEYHVDKPIVDYIRVFKGKNGFLSEGDINFQRQGIGLALYLEAAEWLATKKLHLHASQLQSEEAQKVWEVMESKGWVLHEGKRRHLDATKLS